MNNHTLRNNHHLALAAVAAVCLAGAALGAAANGLEQDAPALTVRYGDLNLDTQAGAARLFNRIRHAAATVCGEEGGTRRLDELAAAKACVDRAILASVQSVNNPKLTREYQTRMGSEQTAINIAARP